MSTSEQDEQVAIPVVYLGLEETSILYANQFAVQIEGNDFIVTAGQVAPPLLLGTVEEQREQAKQLPYVPIRVVGRFAVSRERVQQLAELLQQQIRRHDEQLTGGEGRGHDS